MPVVVLYSVGSFSYACRAAYKSGVVTVTGTGFESGSDYLVRVVDLANSSIKAMAQTKADGSGFLSASILPDFWGI